MDVLIVGSIALDDVRTPFGSVQRALGGSAVYSSLAANYFSAVGVVGVVGRDFPEEHWKLLQSRRLQLDGVETAEGDTFHWAGYYEYDMGKAQTLDTQLNVFARFRPHIPAAWQSTPFVFLANIDPELQGQVLDQIQKPRFVMLDTMNYWIENKRPQLLDVIRRVDMVVVNDAEARQLADTPNLLQAASWIRRHGPEGVVIKKGEHGALIFWREHLFVIPAFPLEVIKDPTGAGDTFAGGLIGVLARQCAAGLQPQDLRLAASLGTVLASFVVEDFSVRSFLRLSERMIRERYAQLRGYTQLETLPDLLVKAGAGE